MNWEIVKEENFNSTYKEEKLMFKLGKTKEKVGKNMNKLKMRNWCKEGKKKLGVLACAVAVMSLGFGDTAYANTSGTITKNSATVKYSATEHSVTTKVYYPVSNGDHVASLTSGVNYKTYKSGKSGATSSWVSYRDTTAKTVTVYNGNPCYYVGITTNVSSNKYIAAISYYGNVSFDNGKTAISVSGSKSVTW